MADTNVHLSHLEHDPVPADSFTILHSLQFVPLFVAINRSKHTAHVINVPDYMHPVHDVWFTFNYHCPLFSQLALLINGRHASHF